MKRFYMIILTLLTVIGLGSCYEDKGNYDYDWVASAQVLNFEESYTYTVGDAMTLRPDLVFQKQDGMEIHVAAEDRFDDTEYEYYWIAIRYDNNQQRFFRDTIGRERNLNYIVNLPAEKYLVEYHVYNKEHDLRWISKFDLKVTLSAPEGWLLLEDKDGIAELSIYAVMGDGSLRMVHNVLSASGIPEDMLAGPRQVFATYQNNKGSGVWILTDQFTGYLDVKARHQWTSMQNLSNYMLDRNVIFDKILNVGFYTVFGFAGDQLYLSRFPGILFTENLLHGKDFKLAPYIAAVVNNALINQVLVFDKTNKCFKFIDVSGTFSFTDADDSFPKGYDLMLMSVVGSVGMQKIYCLLKDNKAVYQMEASSPTIVESPATQVSTSEQFLNAEQCVFHQETGIPFYLYQGKLYVNRPVIGDQEVKFYQSGVQVDLPGTINYITSVAFSNIEGHEHWDEFSKYLVVATELPDGRGRVYFLTPETANAQKLIISDIVETPHKVISIAYQRPDINDF